MALKKNKGAEAPSELKMDLTPMIDCTFQLIIFFILVTDMSQRELEILTLPRAPAAIEDKSDPGDDRIVVNIVDMTNPEVLRECNPNWPPIFIKGRQMESLEKMREVLRLYADPRRFPDKEKPPVDEKNGIWPSKKPLLIRCDHHQVFGWVQAVMQYCSIVPAPKGANPQRHLAEELARSPLIYKIELGAKRKDAKDLDPVTGK
jgi:hypothetical protein